MNGVGLRQCTNGYQTAEWKQYVPAATQGSGMHRHARDLPWRRTRDPYACLGQRNHVATDTSRNRDSLLRERFMAAFPDRRQRSRGSRRTQQCYVTGRDWATTDVPDNCTRPPSKCVAEHNGTSSRIPCEATWDDLPGIGRYTRGAILSIAFDQRQPILEANTIRLNSRLVAYDGETTSQRRTATCCGRLRRTFCQSKDVGYLQSGAHGTG